MVAARLVVERLQHFVTAPFTTVDMVPALIPIVVGLTVIELYFGRYTAEELGWNSAVANSVLWITTAATLFFKLWRSGGLQRHVLYPVAGLAVLGVIVVIFNFYHVWPKTVAYTVSSGLVIYTFAYLLIVQVHAPLPLDAATGVATAVFFLAVTLFFTIIHWLEPSAYT